MTWAAPLRPSRREVLAGCGLLAVSGCLPLDGGSPGATVPAEVRLRARAAADVARLAARYDAVLARFPAASTELATLAAEHAAHVTALRGPRPSGSTSPPATSPAPLAASSASSASSVPPVPPTLRAARAELAAAERAAAGRRARQAVGAPAGTARLLASIAACEAAHAALLERS